MRRYVEITVDYVHAEFRLDVCSSPETIIRNVSASSQKKENSDFQQVINAL